MSKKPKFKPQVIRIKLNPEQAVLTCTCYSAGGGMGWYIARLPGNYGNIKSIVTSATPVIDRWPAYLCSDSKSYVTSYTGAPANDGPYFQYMSAGQS